MEPLQQARFTIRSVQELHQLAFRLAERLRRGSLVGLIGPLGAGKTELVRGFARALGIREEVSSPTFVLESVYEASSDKECALHHWDLFRITSGDLECEIADYRGDPAKLTFIEWPERVAWIQDLLDLKILISLAGLNTVPDPAAEASEQEHAALGGVREVEILEITPGTLAGAITL